MRRNFLFFCFLVLSVGWEVGGVVRLVWLGVVVCLGVGDFFGGWVVVFKCFGYIE